MWPVPLPRRDWHLTSNENGCPKLQCFERALLCRPLGLSLACALLSRPRLHDCTAVLARPRLRKLSAGRIFRRPVPRDARASASCSSVHRTWCTTSPNNATVALWTVQLIRMLMYIHTPPLACSEKKSQDKRRLAHGLPSTPLTAGLPCTTGRKHTKLLFAAIATLRQPNPFYILSKTCVVPSSLPR